MDMVSIQSLPRGVVHLVEDDEQTREATARFLRAAGHIVQTYSSSGEFLASPHAEGCVLLDLQLLGASGLQVQQQLAAEEEPLPVVFLSAQADVSDSVQAMKDGAVDFLTDLFVCVIAGGVCLGLWVSLRVNLCLAVSLFLGCAMPPSI